MRTVYMALRTRLQYHHVSNTEHFVDYLSSIPFSALTETRHVNIRAYPFPICLPGGEHSIRTTFGFSSLPYFFPGLRLDPLTVQDGFHGADVEEDGWGHNATYGEVGI
jgi:hypothetical protein